jgi:hypothetical protein
MKLNNAQITALADKFRKELLENKTIVEKQEVEKYYKNKKPLFISCLKLLQKNTFLTKVTVSLEKNYEASVTKESKYNNWINSYNMINNLINLKIVIPTIEEVKTDIILATIDAQSVEDIMKTLKSKYK